VLAAAEAAEAELADTGARADADGDGAEHDAVEVSA
jgi:hypothetical protein